MTGTRRAEGVTGRGGRWAGVSTRMALLALVLCASQPVGVRGWMRSYETPDVKGMLDSKQSLVLAAAPTAAAAPTGKPAKVSPLEEMVAVEEKVEKIEDVLGTTTKDDPSFPQAAEAEMVAMDGLSSVDVIRLTPPGAYRDSTYRKAAVQVSSGTCDPEKLPPEMDRCHYVNTDAACWKERSSAVIDYNKLYYCYASGNLYALILMTLWLALIFYTLAVTADVFFCPAVSEVSELLKLPPDIAGATLLAFGNGAPDVFTQIASITHGERPNVVPALSSVLGSGLFITCVVLSTVLMVAKQPLVLDWTFKRDSLAYFLAVILIIGVMADGKVELYQSAFLGCYYVGYLCLVIFFGTNTNLGEEDEEEPPYRRGNTVREFGIHPTMNWIRNKIEWERRSTLSKICSPATVPVLLFMHLTMTPEQEPSRVYSGMLCIFGSIFFLHSMGVESGEHSRFFFIFFSMMVLSATLYITSSVEMITGKWLMPTFTFVQAILWLKLCAGTLVELLDMMGGLMGLSPAFLGATVLAWANCVADLAGNAAIARTNPKMAVSACLAGPLFNLSAGMSGSLIYMNFLYGDVKVNLDNNVLIIVGTTAVLMGYMCVGVPYIHKYHLSPGWIVLLLAVYIGFNSVYLMSQMGAIFTEPWIKPKTR